MKLIDRSGYRADPFTRTAIADAAGIDRPLVALAELPEALAGGSAALGVEVANTTKIELLEPHIDQLALIAIVFPAFSDGRGFSLARRLRRAGFTGQLRAVGPLIADQFAYALACGFDEIELPDTSADRQPIDQWRVAASVVSATYQNGYIGGGGILDRRRAARNGGQ